MGVWVGGVVGFDKECFLIKWEWKSNLWSWVQIASVVVKSDIKGVFGWGTLFDQATFYAQGTFDDFGVDFFDKGVFKIPILMVAATLFNHHYLLSRLLYFRG